MRRALFTCLLATSSLGGCVLTTFEAPGDAPRVAPSPQAEAAKASAASRDAATAIAPGEPEEIAARHLLVAYQGALRVSPSVTRSKGEAQTRALEALKRAKAGEDFEQLVREYSDEPGAADKGGSLGRFKHGMMVPAFEKAAFKLAPGQISDVVETQFGFHVIQRTE